MKKSMGKQRREVVAYIYRISKEFPPELVEAQVTSFRRWRRSANYSQKSKVITGVAAVQGSSQKAITLCVTPGLRSPGRALPGA